MKTEITKDSLIAFGMKMNFMSEDKLDPVTPMSKTIGESDLGKLEIIVTRMYNVDQIALSMPDGGTLYISPESIEDLKLFEGMINKYEPNF